MGKNKCDVYVPLYYDLKDRGDHSCKLDAFVDTGHLEQIEDKRETFNNAGYETTLEAWSNT
jgi:hypothetical protein